MCHPAGYIASDIFSRYKRQCGFNVLHPMGYDAFGLPAEQYAIQTGQHPAVTTERNIARYREQLDKIGFSFDWNREVRTCDPAYYKWTQWAFLKMFGSYYCRRRQQARPIEELTETFARSGTEGIDAACTAELHFTAGEWAAHGRTAARAGAAKLPAGLPRRHDGQLVSATGHGAGQRRGEGGASVRRPATPSFRNA